MKARPFPHSSLPETFASFYERMVALAPAAAGALKQSYGIDPGDRAVSGLCTDDRSFNAYAWSAADADHVAFTAALPCLLHFCFNHLLCTPGLLPGVGNVSREEPARFPRGIPLRLDTDTSLAEALVAVPQLSRPVDDGRAFAASALTELATMFAVLHEVGHLACGHARFAELHLGSEVIAEFFDLDGIFRRRRFLRQVWEMEADLVAAMLLTRWIFGPEPNRAFLSDAFAIGSDSAYEHGALAAMLAAVYVLFLLMNQRNRARGLFRTHPPPLVRVCYVHNVVRLFAERDFQMNVDGLDAEVDRTILEVNAAWRMMGLPLPPLAADPLDGMSLLRRQRERLAGAYQIHAWIPPTAWRLTVADLYSYNFLQTDKG